MSCGMNWPIGVRNALTWSHLVMRADALSGSSYVKKRNVQMQKPTPETTDFEARLRASEKRCAELVAENKRLRGWVNGLKRLGREMVKEKKEWGYVQP